MEVNLKTKPKQSHVKSSKENSTKEIKQVNTKSTKQHDKEKDKKPKINTNNNKNEGDNYKGESTDDSAGDMLSLIKSISSLLSDIIKENATTNPKDSLTDKSKSGKISLGQAFYSKKPPAITIFAYLERIQKYSKLEDSTLILALIYIDRLCDMNDYQMNNFNIHRLLLASLVLSIKYNEDDYYSNSYYAKVGGISLEEINNLENEFITMINFSLFVDEDLFYKYSSYLGQFDLVK